ncbi:Hypothetical_protein [Hexamita inflata]|uniref:Hypothetical_protein n=1 Tax=Hexamita inflata TaxID=28002 RepID=A0AA86P6I5_9EUKA|nr:Hypothetical protein HINF_LOCUS18772 [Hexamita inflata]
MPRSMRSQYLYHCLSRLSYIRNIFRCRSRIPARQIFHLSYKSLDTLQASRSKAFVHDNRNNILLTFNLVGRLYFQKNKMKLITCALPGCKIFLSVHIIGSQWHAIIQIFKGFNVAIRIAVKRRQFNSGVV